MKSRGEAILKEKGGVWCVCSGRGVVVLVSIMTEGYDAQRRRRRTVWPEPGRSPTDSDNGDDGDDDDNVDGDDVNDVMMKQTAMRVC